MPRLLSFHGPCFTVFYKTAAYRERSLFFFRVKTCDHVLAYLPQDSRALCRVQPVGLTAVLGLGSGRLISATADLPVNRYLSPRSLSTENRSSVSHQRLL